jgi:DNA-binding NarL/FixJ family response regulator
MGAADDDQIAVIVLGEHLMTAEALAAGMSADPELRAVGAFASVAEFATACADLRPDVAVIDRPPSDGHAVEDVRRIIRDVPTLAVVWLLPERPERAVLEQLLDAGFGALQSKSDGLASLVRGVQRVAVGELVLSTDLAEILRPPTDRRRVAQVDLTARERQILALLADGHSTEEIAAELLVSVHTVRNHVGSILRKLEVRSRLEAVAVARRLGLVEEHPLGGTRRSV